MCGCVRLRHCGVSWWWAQMWVGPDKRTHGTSRHSLNEEEEVDILSNFKGMSLFFFFF